MPDGDGKHRARHEEDDKRDPEPDPGPPCALPMLDPGLPASTMQTYGVPDSLVVDDRDVVRPDLTHSLCHRTEV